MKPDKICFSLVFIITIATISWITSCKHDADILKYPEMCFKRDILPIYSNDCSKSGCHDGNGEMMALDTFPNIRNTVAPYNPDKSSSYQAMTTTWGGNLMPPGQPLSQEKRTKIRLWIEQGANETKCSDSAIYRSREDKIKKFR